MNAVIAKARAHCPIKHIPSRAQAVFFPFFLRGGGSSAGLLEAVKHIKGVPGVSIERGEKKMSIFQIIVVFLVFCIVWILTNFINQAIIARVQQEQQRKRIDAAFCQVARLVIRAKAEAAAQRRSSGDQM